MVATQNPEIRKAVDTLYELSADERTRAEYELHLKAVRDRVWLRDDGYQDGLQKGIQTGIQTGQREGAKKVIELIKSGKSPEEAMAILGLSDTFNSLIP